MAIPSDLAYATASKRCLFLSAIFLISKFGGTALRYLFFLAADRRATRHKYPVEQLEQLYNFYNSTILSDAFHGT